MRSLSLSILCSLLLTTAAFAQSTDRELKDTQKALRNALVKHVDSIPKVEFDGCEASVKVVVWRGYVPDQPRGGSVGSFPSGFPYDATSGSFSAGPDTSRRTDGRSVRYEFDLSKVDISKLVVEPARRPGTSRVYLVDADRVSMKGDFPAPPFFSVVTRTSHAAAIDKAFRAAVAACTDVK